VREKGSGMVDNATMGFFFSILTFFKKYFNINILRKYIAFHSLFGRANSTSVTKKYSHATYVDAARYDTFDNISDVEK